MSDFTVLVHSLLLNATKTELILLGILVVAICTSSVIFAAREIKKAPKKAQGENHAE